MARRPATALLLAAGRGERMRPLTDTCPKPLLQVQGKPLLQWHLEALARAGCESAVVNTAWLGEHIEARFGDHFVPAPAVEAVAATAQGARTGVVLCYSHEGRDFGGALETAGGIVRALPHLADVFWVAAGDVFVPDFVFEPTAMAAFAASGLLAHIWLVPNPAHNPGGDFGLSDQGLALNLPKVATPESTDAPQRYTFSTIALYQRAFFEAAWCGIPAGNPAGLKAPLAPLLRAAMDAGQVSATLYTGKWTDVGTPERLQQLNSDPRPMP
ncbi:MAG: nucleotidyltransferase family protein [Betaproteobacteria bacterium]